MEKLFSNNNDLENCTHKTDFIANKNKNIFINCYLNFSNCRINRGINQILLRKIPSC
jgi:hypothetical protein